MEDSDRLCLCIYKRSGTGGSKVKGQGSGMQLLVSLHFLLPLDDGSVLLLDLVDPVVQRTLTLLAVLWLLCVCVCVYVCVHYYMYTHVYVMYTRGHMHMVTWSKLFASI